MNINSIDLTLLKLYSRELKNEAKKFNSLTYNTFLNSYLYENTDKKLGYYINNINKMYIEIEKKYSKINNYLEKYIINVESLERSIINGVGNGNLEANIKNYIDSNLTEINR